MTDEATTESRAVQALKAALLDALAYLSVLHAGTVDNHWRWTARDLATDLAPLLARRLAVPTEETPRVT